MGYSPKLSAGLCLLPMQQDQRPHPATSQSKGVPSGKQRTTINTKQKHERNNKILTKSCSIVNLCEGSFTKQWDTKSWNSGEKPWSTERLKDEDEDEIFNLGGTPSTTRETSSKIAICFACRPASICRGGFRMGTKGSGGFSGGRGKCPVASSINERPCT